MATINENDLEMLEALLDGELAPQQRDKLNSRLVAEPDLAAELENLRAEHQLREAMFKTLEGGEEAVVEKAFGEIKKYELRRESRIVRIRRVGYAAAAAACIILGFLVGWMGATNGKSNVQAGELPYRVEIQDESGQTLAVQKFQSLEEAREFSDDLYQWQFRQDLLLNGQVQATKHSDEF